MATHQEKLNRVFQYFCKQALATPWRVKDMVSIHLSPEIMKDIASRWNTIISEPTLRAGFLLALLETPKKKYNAENRDPALELCQKGIDDINPYIRMLAVMMSKFICNGYMDLEFAMAIEEISIAVNKVTEHFPKTTLSVHPNELCFLQPNVAAQIHLMESNDNLSFLPLPALEERIKQYGIPEELTKIHHVTPHSPFPHRKLSGRYVAPTSLGIPKRKSLSSTNIGFSLPPTMTDHQTKLKGLRKSSKIIILDIDEPIAIRNQSKPAAIDVKNEREKKIKDKELSAQLKRDEKRIKKEQADEDRLEKRSKAADVELNKKRLANDEKINLVEDTSDHRILPNNIITGSRIELEAIIGSFSSVSSEDLLLIIEFLKGKYGSIFFLSKIALG